MFIFDYLIKDKPSQRFADMLDDAIVLTDKMVDHEVTTPTALNVLALMNGCIGLSSSIKDVNKICTRLTQLIAAEHADILFVPGQSELAHDLEMWAAKAGRLSVEFQVACCCDETLDTPANWRWITGSQEKGLILNDCSDILSGRYEDFIQVRRNYVMLIDFEPEMYYTWRENIDSITLHAQQIRDSVEFPKPEDEKLMKAWEVFNGVRNVR